MSKEFKDLVHECGMSLTGAARKLGEKYTTVENWSQGKCRVPIEALDTLTQISEAIKEITKR